MTDRCMYICILLYINYTSYHWVDIANLSIVSSMWITSLPAEHFNLAGHPAPARWGRPDTTKPELFREPSGGFWIRVCRPIDG